MAKKNTKNVGGRPARAKTAATARMEVRCTDAELKEYSRLARLHANADRSTLVRDAIAYYASAKKRAAKRKRSTKAGNIVTDLFWALVVAGVLMIYAAVKY